MAKKKKWTKEQSDAFYEWSNTITVEMMDTKAPIDIWERAFRAGVEASKREFREYLMKKVRELDNG